MLNFMHVFNIKLFHFYLDLRLRTLEISWIKSARCRSKILKRFGSFLAFFFEKIEFGLSKLNLAFFQCNLALYLDVISE